MQKENHLLYKIIAEVGGLIQMAIFGGLFFGSLTLLDEPFLLIVLFILGGTISISVGAVLAHNGHVKQLTESDTRAITAGKSLIIQQQLLPFSIYLKRSLLAWLVFTGGMILVGVVFLGTISRVVMLGHDVFGDTLIVRMVLIMILCGLTIFGLFMTYIIFGISEAVVDFYLYKHSEIQEMYTNGNPFKNASLSEVLFPIIKTALLASVGVAGLMGIAVVTRLLEQMDLALWAWGLILLGGFAGVVLIVRYILRMDASDAESESIIRQIEEHVVQQYGIESEEAHAVRDEFERWRNLSPEEKKRERDEADNIDLSNISETTESLTAQSYRLFMIYLAVMFIVGGFLMIVVGYISSQMLNLHEHVGGIMLITILVCIVGGMYVALKFGFNNLELSDTVEQMAKALDDGDVPVAKKHLEQAKLIVSKYDYGWLLAAVSLATGDIDGAETIARESLSSIMFIDEERRNNTLLALTLVQLGNVLIEQGKYNEARQSIQQSLQYEKNSVDTYISLAETYLYEGDSKRAMAIVEQAKPMLAKSDIESETIMLKICEAWALALQGYHRKSLQLLQSVFDDHQDVSVSVRAGMNYYAGHIFRQVGRESLANRAFQHAMTLLPDSLYEVKAEQYL